MTAYLTEHESLGVIIDRCSPARVPFRRRRCELSGLYTSSARRYPCHGLMTQSSPACQFWLARCLLMTTTTWMQGPRCARCGGGSTRAVRTQSRKLAEQLVYYLTYVWACRVCGRESFDEVLARLNDWSAQAACLTARQGEGHGRDWQQDAS